MRKRKPTSPCPLGQSKDQEEENPRGRLALDEEISNRWRRPERIGCSLPRDGQAGTSDQNVAVSSLLTGWRPRPELGNA